MRAALGTSERGSVLVLAKMFADGLLANYSALLGGCKAMQAKIEACKGAVPSEFIEEGYHLYTFSIESVILMASPQVRTNVIQTACAFVTSLRALLIPPQGVSEEPSKEELGFYRALLEADLLLERYLLL